MALNCKGIISLPIKLTVSFLIISLMVPPMVMAVDNIQQDIDRREMATVAVHLADWIDRTGAKGSGYSTHIDLSIPSGGYIMLGGNEGYVVRVYMGDNQVDRVILDSPVLGNDIVLYGDVILEMRGFDYGVEVKEI